jgi:thiol:disulfide interchange protein DsbA
MKQIKRWLLTIALSVLPGFALAAATPGFVAGKEYQVLAKVPVVKASKNVEVIEFFSYGCPGCYQFEPLLQLWLGKHVKRINFSRVPVSFHPNWDVYAKAYYVAKTLNVLDKIHQPLFDAIHVERQSLADQQAMADFFAKHGVDRQKFLDSYNFIPQIGAQIENGAKLAKTYNIIEIPTMVIGGKYRTNVAMVQGDAKRFLALLDYLVAKAAKANAGNP